MLTPYGYSSLIKVFIFCLTLSAAAMFLPSGFRTALLVTASTALLFSLYFFRDPERNIPDEKRMILAPADGKVLLVQQQNNSFTGSSSTLISIFMSPLNVHVNRIPLSGKVIHLRYIPGQFLMAFDHRSTQSNEKMEIGIDNGLIRVLFSQISGFLARRIVCRLHSGDPVIAGSRFGMIKFGSRIDIILPSSASVLVRPGQSTRAGETILARY